MREARKKNAAEGGAKEEFISEEVEKTRRQNEMELKEFEDGINHIKGEKETLIEEYRQIEMQETDDTLENQVNDKKKEWKKKKDLLQELKTVETNGIEKLDEEVKELEGKFDGLHQQLEEYQKPLEEEIYTKKNKLKDMKLEYGFKHDQIKEIKKNIKKSLAELKYKKEMLKFMEEEYSKIPKDINRNQYIKRINEVVGNVKLQQEEIQRTLKDLDRVEEDSKAQVEKISRIDGEVKEMLVKSAKKDKVSKGIYQEMMRLKECFNKLVENAQGQNNMKNATREVQMNVESFKGKNLHDLKKIQGDLENIQKENEKFEIYISNNA